MTCVHHSGVIQARVPTPKIPSVPPVLPFLHPLQLLATSDLFFFLTIVLPFSEYHRVGIIQSVTFSNQLLSLNNLCLSFLHVFSWLESPFLLSPE